MCACRYDCENTSGHTSQADISRTQYASGLSMMEISRKAAAKCMTIERCLLHFDKEQCTDVYSNRLYDNFLDDARLFFYVSSNNRTFSSCASDY